MQFSCLESTWLFWVCKAFSSTTSAVLSGELLFPALCQPVCVLHTDAPGHWGFPICWWKEALFSVLLPLTLLGGSFFGPGSFLLCKWWYKTQLKTPWETLQVCLLWDSSLSAQVTSVSRTRISLSTTQRLRRAPPGHPLAPGLGSPLEAVERPPSLRDRSPLLCGPPCLAIVDKIFC